MSESSHTGTARTLPLDKISTREAERLRPADPDQVLKIAASIRKRGQLQPIGVYRANHEKKGGQPWVLVFGLHRLLACQHLGLAEIEFREVPRDEALHAEIEENLFRAELTALDRAIAVSALRQLHVNENGPVKRGGDQSAKSALWSDELVEIGEKVGLSQRSMKRADAIGQGIPKPLQEALRGTEAATNQSLLSKIAAMKSDRQLKILRGITEERISLADAIEATSSKEKRAESRHDRMVSKMLTAWKAATDEAQDEFLQQIGVTRERSNVA